MKRRPASTIPTKGKTMSGRTDQPVTSRIEAETIERDSIHVGSFYRDRFGSIYEVVGFDGNGVQVVLYCATAHGVLAEDEHSQSWSEFLENFDGEAEPPLCAKRTIAG